MTFSSFPSSIHIHFHVHLQLLHGFSKVLCLRPQAYPKQGAKTAEHVKAARLNGLGIFEHPRQVHISLGTFASLGNLVNLKVSKKVWVVTCSDGPWWGFYQKTMPKKKRQRHILQVRKSLYPLISVTGVFGHIRNFLPPKLEKINRGILGLISWTFIFAWRSFQLVLWTSRPGPVCVQSRTWDSQPSRKPGHIPISYFWAIHR